MASEPDAVSVTAAGLFLRAASAHCDRRPCPFAAPCRRREHPCAGDLEQRQTRVLPRLISPELTSAWSSRARRRASCRSSIDPVGRGTAGHRIDIHAERRRRNPATCHLRFACHLRPARHPTRHSSRASARQRADCGHSRRSRTSPARPKRRTHTLHRPGRSRRPPASPLTRRRLVSASCCSTSRAARTARIATLEHRAGSDQSADPRRHGLDRYSRGLMRFNRAALHDRNDIRSMRSNRGGRSNPLAATQLDREAPSPSPPLRTGRATERQYAAAHRSNP